MPHLNDQFRHICVIALAAMLAACSTGANEEIEIREAWIEMPDGVRLAADIFVPAGAEVGDRFPVLL